MSGLQIEGASPPATTPTADAALVAGLVRRDPEAVAELYDRYAERLLGFCTGMLRDSHEAADALHDTILVAADRIGQLRDPERLRPWLYAIARTQCLSRLRKRERTALAEDPTELVGGRPMADVDPEGDGARAAEGGEAAELVWAAAEGLDEGDRVLLELHLRQGLTGGELAAAAGVKAGQISMVTGRMRERLERALGALLVARHGRRDCDELDGILRDWDGRLTVLMRKRVARHVERCVVCEDRRTGLVAPLGSLAVGAPVVLATVDLRAAVVAAAEEVWGGAPAPDVTQIASWGGDGFPPDPPGAPTATSDVEGDADGDAETDAPPDGDAEADGGPEADGSGPGSAAGTNLGKGAGLVAGVGLAKAVEGPSDGLAPGDSPVAAADEDGTDRRVRRRAVLAVAAALVLLSGGLLAWRSATSTPSEDVRADGGAAQTADRAADDEDEADGTPRSTSTTEADVASSSTTTPTTAGTTTPAPEPTTSTTEPPDGGPADPGPTAPDDGGSGSGSGSGTSPPPSTSPAPPPDPAPTIGSTSLSRSSLQTTCNPSASTAVASASVSDTGGTLSVTLHYVGPDGASGQKPMSGGGTRTATLGPFADVGTATWWVTASDGTHTTESAHRSVAVDPCPG